MRSANDQADGAAVALDGRYTRAYDLLETGLAISRLTGNTINEHEAPQMLALTALGARDYGRGRRYLSEAIPVMREQCTLTGYRASVCKSSMFP
jgi:hypothetical protein